MCFYPAGEPLDIGSAETTHCPLIEAAFPGGHGTAIAKILNSVGNNHIGIAGVGWKSTLMPIRVFDKCTFENGLRTKDVINALAYAASMGAQVVSVSYNHANTPAAHEAYQKCGSFDMVISIAAGNDGCDLDGSASCGGYPARYNMPHLIKVCGTMPDDALGHGGTIDPSDYGEVSVQVAAPGWYLPHFPGISSDCGPAGCLVSGTSFASPIVAGIVALYRAEHPEATAPQVVQRIIQTPRPVSGLVGKCQAGGVISAAGMFDQSCGH